MSYKKVIRAMTTSTGSSRSSSPTYSVEISFPQLNEYKVIKGKDKYLVEQKAMAQYQTWEDKWNAMQEKEKIRVYKENRNAEAEKRTKEAKNSIAYIENLLKDMKSHRFVWDKLKDNTEFSLSPPSPKKYEEVPPPPSKTDGKYTPNVGLFGKFSRSKKDRAVEEKNQEYLADYKVWENLKEAVEKKNKEIEEENNKQMNEWEEKKRKYLVKQEKRNQKIDILKQQYEASAPEAIEQHALYVLGDNTYPEFIPTSYEVSYNPDNSILIVDGKLPSLDDMPKLVEVKYIASKDEVKETYLSESQIAKLYDSLIYQITLKTINDLYGNDTLGTYSAIVFNGWVESINRASGNMESACILSLQASKDEFSKVNLSQVDPKECFRFLKGVGSSKLSSLTPIKPLLQMNKEDKRFIEGKNVDYDDSTNLAAMDWEDFEHLIRVVFENEFSANGGEVKVTQASRDGGVDAVAFDPDPIRGGKIVIQAKRYTNVVGVSAVRDLYGTVLNEGATKGILVTTSNYGPDAYSFAKDKPLTLLNGSNLLHLLEKHGHKARININEAKKLMK